MKPSPRNILFIKDLEFAVELADTLRSGLTALGHKGLDGSFITKPRTTQDPPSRLDWIEVSTTLDFGFSDNLPVRAKVTLLGTDMYAHGSDEFSTNRFKVVIEALGVRAFSADPDDIYGSDASSVDSFAEAWKAAMENWCTTVIRQHTMLAIVSVGLNGKSKG